MLSFQNEWVRYVSIEELKAVTGSLTDVNHYANRSTSQVDKHLEKVCILLGVKFLFICMTYIGHLKAIEKAIACAVSVFFLPIVTNHRNAKVTYTHTHTRTHR